MQVAKVIGNVVATQKNERLNGHKLLLVAPFEPREGTYGPTRVAVDEVGAGNGEMVLLVGGSSARNQFSMDAPIDLAIVGIIDEIEMSS
ncbi:MAG: EutN/CcmL family microcompartment protein [Tissierellia bacterium]|nr:EutN/CcmL family microcompartment protein [Tissierellia bacterium]